MLESSGWRWGALDRKNAGVRKHPYRHQEGTSEKSGPATPAVYVQKSGHSHDDVNDVLNGRREQQSPLRLSGHLTS